MSMRLKLIAKHPSNVALKPETSLNVRRISLVNVIEWKTPLGLMDELVYSSKQDTENNERLVLFVDTQILILEVKAYSGGISSVPWASDASFN